MTSSQLTSSPVIDVKSLPNAAKFPPSISYYLEVTMGARGRHRLVLDFAIFPARGRDDGSSKSRD